MIFFAWVEIVVAFRNESNGNRVFTKYASDYVYYLVVDAFWHAEGMTFND